jgi:hypothetical protein
MTSQNLLGVCGEELSSSQEYTDLPVQWCPTVFPLAHCEVRKNIPKLALSLSGVLFLLIQRHPQHSHLWASSGRTGGPACRESQHLNTGGDRPSRTLPVLTLGCNQVLKTNKQTKKNPSISLKLVQDISDQSFINGNYIVPVSLSAVKWINQGWKKALSKPKAPKRKN